MRGVGGGCAGTGVSTRELIRPVVSLYGEQADLSEAVEPFGFHQHKPATPAKSAFLKKDYGL